MYTRMTTRMMMTSYKAQLNYKMADLSAKAEAVQNERKYQRDSEDTVSSTRAYQYRRETARNEMYLENTKTMASLLDTREGVVQNLSDMAKTVRSDILSAITGTSSLESRTAYAQQLNEMQDQAIQFLNTSYGGQFLFGGISTKKVPYEIKDKTVHYRGVPVDGLTKEKMSQYQNLKSMDFAALKAEAAGDQDQLAKLDEQEKQLNELQKELDANLGKLEEFQKETQFVDLGFGLAVTDGEVNPNSAYNMASNGVSFLGSSVDDKNGKSMNFVQLIGDLADAIVQDPIDQDYIKQLTDNMKEAETSLVMELTELGSQMNFMETNQTRIEDVLKNLAEKTNSAEFIPEAEAITNFEQAQYAYRASLQIGSQILTMSFLDYMR